MRFINGVSYIRWHIAAGQTSAAEVFTDWKEENASYSGQGHRRNMLDATYKAVGIGHVVYQGCHYWVQEFGDTVVNATSSAANDSTQVVDVDVAASYVVAEMIYFKSHAWNDVI